LKIVTQHMMQYVIHSELLPQLISSYIVNEAPLSGLIQCYWGIW